MDKYHAISDSMDFRPITHKDMATIWPYLQMAPGRTTDFSYGGVLMWVDYFRYTFCIVDDTLFIKGRLEDDRLRPAFSLPIGALPLEKSVAMLREHIKKENVQESLEFSAIPEEVVSGYMRLGPARVSTLEDWGDYLYDAEQLATLSGKKMSKKRNHVNKFMAENPDWELVELTSDNVSLALEFMDATDCEADANSSAAAERLLSRKLLHYIAEGDPVLKGALLFAGGKVCAYTIGDMKGDTLFIHVEKATRSINGSYEAINKLFAEKMLQLNPEIKYINREDDAGDEGLRKAKESYKPLAKLAKFNVIF